MNILDTIIRHTQFAGFIFVMLGTVIIISNIVYNKIKRARQN